MPNPGLLTISGSDYGIVINNYIVYHNSSEIAIGFSKFFEKISEFVKLHQKSEAEDLCEVSGELLLESHSVSLLSAGGGVVNLDFGLGAGGSDNNACVILEEESDNIGLRQGDMFGLAVSGGLYGSFVVSGCNYAQTADSLRTVLSEVGHDLAHALHAALALAGEGVELVEVYAVLVVHSLSRLDEGDTLCAVESSHFADEHGSYDGVLVAYIAACEVAVALLEAEDEAVHLTGGLQLCDLVTDPLEAGQHVAALDTVLLGHLVGQRGGDDGLDNEIITVDLNRLNPSIHQIYFFLNNCGQEDFSQIPYAAIRMYEGTPTRVKEVFAQYDVAAESKYQGKTALIMGKLYKRNGEWKFAAIGDAYDDKFLGFTIHRIIKDYVKK